MFPLDGSDGNTCPMFRTSRPTTITGTNNSNESNSVRLPVPNSTGHQTNDQNLLRKPSSYSFLRQCLFRDKVSGRPSRTLTGYFTRNFLMTRYTRENLVGSTFPPCSRWFYMNFNSKSVMFITL